MHNSRNWLRSTIFLVGSVAVVCSSDLAAQPPRRWTIDPVEITGQAKSTTFTDPVPGSNSVVDIIYSAPDVWAATGKGVSHLILPGNVWTTYDAADGLGSSEIPALAVFPNGVWSGTSHTEIREGRVVSWGDGIFRFNSATQHWDNFSPALDQASGPFQLVYDLAYMRGRVFATCFAGGLVASSDDGQTWANIFADGTARADFENKSFIDLNNRYFAAVVDTVVPESAAVWTGTAYGINKYIYLADTLKPIGYRFNDLHINGSVLYAATDNGLSRTSDRGGSWRSFFASSDGFPSDNVTAVAAIGDTIWAGFADEAGTTGMGLAVSLDRGGTWTITRPLPSMGAGRVPRDIVLTKSYAMVACEAGGVIRLLHDSPYGEWGLDPGTAYTILFVATSSDSTLFVGLDDGIRRWTWPFMGGYLQREHPIGIPSDTIGQRVIRLGMQPTPCTTTATALWALCESSGGNTTDGFAVSSDSGETWDVSSRRLGVRDAVFEGCRFWLATDSGLAEGHIRNLDSLTFTAGYRTAVNNNRIGTTPLSLAGEIGQDGSGNPALTALWVGTDSLLARSLDYGITWGVVFSNPDPEEFDLRPFYSYRDVDTLITGFEQLSGNFITALGFQTGGRGTVWAATQATGQARFATSFLSSKEKDGISVTRDAGKTWSVPITGHQVWNFAFDGGVVYAASSQGVLRSPNNGAEGTWDTLNYFVDPVSRAVIDSTTEVFAVEVVGEEVWVGTENGTVILDRSGNTLAVRRGFKAVNASDPGTEGGAYATPVPFSPQVTPGGLRFHYVPPTAGAVTIKIYDYANNLVKTVTNGEHREAGQQYDEADLWDGRNGEGDVVAVGTYFFVIEYQGGETHWGKLVVIP